ncbi:MAG: YtxH domain-containing protein [Acidobacteria bacterium]|nr:YtxH domain-containing protein [Acidobacteriota bacterium]
MDERGKWGERMVYFLFGGLVGAISALLLAPRSGEETREFISSRVKEGRDYVNEGLKSAQEQIVKTKDRLTTEARDAIHRGRKIVDKEKEVISAAIEAGKQAYKEERESTEKKDK